MEALVLTDLCLLLVDGLITSIRQIDDLNLKSLEWSISVFFKNANNTTMA